MSFSSWLCVTYTIGKWRFILLKINCLQRWIIARLIISKWWSLGKIRIMVRSRFVRLNSVCGFYNQWCLHQAHGLCFSVQHGIPPPPSLKNIFKEAINDVGISKPQHGCLTSWSDQVCPLLKSEIWARNISVQGVLLLNTVLTVRRSEANSHRKQGWETFTDAIIRIVNAETEGVVFLLWGKNLL